MRSRLFLNFCLYSKCFNRNIPVFQARYSASVGFIELKKHTPHILNVRRLGLGPTSKDFEESAQTTGPLTKAHATELVLHLNDEERKILHSAIQEFESNRIKEEFEDKLAGQRWRSKLGRPTKVPTLGDVDPTGTYCPVPDDWLKKKYAATVPKPTTKELFHLSFANSIPFVGFGFLDNFIMLIAGDRIESSMSAYITLSPVQLDMPVSRRFANMGRVVGITVGCFLGMTPLLFRDDEKKPDPK